jgi:hypothetical protein
MFGRRFDFCRKALLRLRSESVDPCDESFVARDEKEALLDCDDETELLLMENLSILFASLYFFDIVSATLRSLFFRVDISR